MYFDPPPFWSTSETLPERANEIENRCATRAMENEFVHFVCLCVCLCVCVGFPWVSLSFTMLGTHSIWYYVRCVQIIKLSVMITVITIVTSLRQGDEINFKRNDCIRNGNKICFSWRWRCRQTVSCCCIQPYIDEFVDNFSVCRAQRSTKRCDGFSPKKNLLRSAIATKYTNSCAQKPYIINTSAAWVDRRWCYVG